jgi:CRISPR-associated protein Csd2
VFAFKSSKKNEDSEGADAVSIGVRGPVSIQPAFTVEPVNVISSQITKSVNLETQSGPNGKARDTMGMKHRVEFGVYVAYGAINVQVAEKTGFSEEDAEILKETLRTLFRNDATSARPDGSMEVVSVVWWKHNCANGQYSSAKVHRTLEVNHKTGEVSFNKDLDGLKPEVISGE